MIHAQLAARWDLDAGTLEGGAGRRVVLSQLAGCFMDDAAFERVVAERHDPLVYTVSTRAPSMAEGDLHCGLGRLLPGRVGAEYYFTRGHLHAWREAAEIYIGLRGHGVMLLEDPVTGLAELLPLHAGGMVHVPGHIAHRTINTGPEPLLYLGITPARAGHDYGPPDRPLFRHAVVESGGRPALVPRTTACP